MRSSLFKFMRFGTVGALGFVIDFAVTWLMLSIFGLFEYVANAIGFSIAASSNYALNRKWTWRSKNPNVKVEFVKFLLVSLAGLGVNSFVIYLFLLPGYTSFSAFGFEIDSFWIAKLVATGVVMLWNFLVNNYFTFRH